MAAFADISYFGDLGDFGGEPQWSGRVTEVSQLDRFDWGGGRKLPFSSTMSGKSAADMERIIDDALNRKERRKEMMESVTGVSSLLSDFNRKDNAKDGVTVGMQSPMDCVENDASFAVDGATTHSQFGTVSRIAYNQQNDTLCQFVRQQSVSGMGRTVGIGAERVQDVVKIHRPGFYFYLERKDNKLKIKNCIVFLGCLGEEIRCEDVDVPEDCEGTYFAIVDFETEEYHPKLTVELKDVSFEEFKKDESDGYKFVFPLYEFEKGICKRGNPSIVILPTYTFMSN